MRIENVQEESRYIPALSFRWLTPFYDPVLKWGMREEIFKRHLVAQADLRPGMQVLDLGCGTGTLTILLKQSQLAAGVNGLDGDPDVLDIAQDKASNAGASIHWSCGLAFALPYTDGVFDRVVASLVLHHMTSSQKRRTFGELQRVLRPGGELHIVDFGRPHSPVMSAMALVMRHFEETADHFAGLLPAMLSESGFAQVTETSYFATVFGPLSLYAAMKPQ